MTTPPIAGWTVARFYRTPVGVLMADMNGPFNAKASSTCSHGVSPGPECPCGFTTLASRQDAEDQSFGLTVLEVHHKRETLWTDGTVIRALTQEVTRANVNPECHECGAVATLLSDVPLKHGEGTALEPSCQDCAAGVTMTLAELGNELGVDVAWDTRSSLRDWEVQAAAEAIINQASMELISERVLERLDDEDALHQWALEVLTGGPEAFLEVLVSVHAVPVAELEKRRKALTHLLAFIGENEKTALEVASVVAGERVMLLAQIALQR